MKTTKHVLGMTLLLFLLSWLSMSSLTFFNSDTGLRFWQARELIANNWQTLAIDYPGRHLDPELAFMPLYCAYAVVNGEVFFSITPFIPMLASFLYVWFGIAGLPIVPVLAGVFAAVGVYKLARLSNLSRPYLLLWSTIVATPLFFYTLQLWDHSLAVACGVWAVYGVAWGLIENRWWPIIGAGIVTAVGMGQRPELYVFALALAAALLLVAWPRWRLLIPFALGGIAGILPIWLWQYRVVGHPLGIVVAKHLFGYGRPESHVFQCIGPSNELKISRFLLYVDGRDPWSFTAALLAIGSVFLLIFWLRLPFLQKRWLLLTVLAMALVGYFMWGVMLWQRPLAGLLTTFPLLGFSLTYLDKEQNLRTEPPAYRLVLFTTLIFLATMILVWPAYGGEHWGGRYLLPAYPLLIFLAFYVFERYERKRPLQKTLQVVGVSLLVVSIILQLISIRLLFLKQQKDVPIRDAIAELPAEVIVTNHPFLPTTFSSLQDEKVFMYVDSEEDIATLVVRLAEHDISRFGFISLVDLPLTVPQEVDDIRIREVTPVLYELEQR